jgi:hypothetical protein
MLAQLDAWERALARRWARAPIQTDGWLYRHGVNARTINYAVGGVVVAFYVGNFSWIGWRMVRGTGAPHSAAVIARVLVLAGAGLLVLGAFWALLRGRGFARPGGVALLASGFVWPWTALDSFGAVNAALGLAEWVRQVPDILLLAVCPVILAFLVPSSTRLIALVELEERGGRGDSASMPHPAPEAAREPAFPELGSQTADADVRAVPRRLTDFDRRRWCAYPLYGMALFSLWRIVDRLCILPPLRLTWHDVVIVGLGNAVMPAFYALVLFWPLRGESLRRVWAHLRAQYPDECPWCGYDVHACPTPVCPECGQLVDSGS